MVEELDDRRVRARKAKELADRAPAAKPSKASDGRKVLADAVRELREKKSLRGAGGYPATPARALLRVQEPCAPVDAAAASGTLTLDSGEAGAEPPRGDSVALAHRLRAELEAANAAQDLSSIKAALARAEDLDIHEVIASGLQEVVGRMVLEKKKWRCLA